MRQSLAIAGTAIVTAALTSAFWIAAYNLMGSPGAQITPAGDIAVVDPPGAPPVAVAEAVVVGPAGLAIPVAGVKPQDLVDTYTQSRAGGARVHNAIDIMAPVGTPVIAAAPGVVERIFYSEGGGGNTVYVRSDDGRWSYYYAHLSAYAPGLREGQRVRRGTPLGYVGHSGNASPDGPHLHFAINRMNPDDRWHQGTPVNPYPLLAGRRVSG
ncbi:MAG TPA: M23 family metallopeptidase [Sphingomicrobium sp.]|nr:M23 family metallopeptidase [Sphingomicrobium sp.]